MTKTEAIEILVDVATKRKPHSRFAITEAVAAVEPQAAAKKPKAKKGGTDVTSL